MLDAPPTRLHDLSKGKVRLIAAGLFVGMTALLLATLDMGFSRDESFYFAYAEGYSEWFVAVERAETPEEVERAFERDRVLRTWSGNFEHPPMMKTLFGFSWRLLARKDRRVEALNAEPDGALTFNVMAMPAVGFDVGDEVILLARQQQGQEVTDPTRELARGVVTAREEQHAKVRADRFADGVDPEEIIAGCTAPLPKAPAELPITPCMGREDRALGLVEESTAFRLPGVLSGALAVMLTFLIGFELFGWLVGLFGALLWVLVPEHFYHAHLCAFDMPIVAATLFVFYAFWRSLRDPRWALVTAVAWGIALLNKHNAFFIPVSLLFFWFWTGREHLVLRMEGWRPMIRLPPLPRALLVMPVVALCMLFVFWPKLWIDPLRAVRDYFAFHLNHEHYMQYWFGQPLQVPPFPLGYPFGKTFFTYTEVFIALFFVGLLFIAPPTRWKAWLGGLFRAARVTAHEKVAVFVLVAGLVPITVISIPTTPIFGGIKHWMPGAPFLALVAGYGLFRLLAALRVKQVAVALAVAALLLAHPLTSSIEYAWVGSSYYNSLFAGGLRGAADKRLMRAFWGHSTQEALAWLNVHAPLNARVFWQDTTWGAYEMYQREGNLRADIRYANSPSGAHVALIDGNQAFWELDVETRKELGVAGPDWMVTKEGTPYLFVYVRPGTVPAETASGWSEP